MSLTLGCNVDSDDPQADAGDRDGDGCDACTPSDGTPECVPGDASPVAECDGSCFDQFGEKNEVCVVTSVDAEPPATIELDCPDGAVTISIEVQPAWVGVSNQGS